MPTATTRSIVPVPLAPTLHLALDLGNSTWKLAFPDEPRARAPAAHAPRLRAIPARDLAQLAAEVATAKARFGPPAGAPAVSCYEAGRDGFWVHRALLTLGVASLAVDSASIQRNRRKRRAKSDRLDPAALTARLDREWARLRTTQREPPTLRAERRQLLATADAGADPPLQMVARRLALKGVGEVSAWLYTTEFFGWRAFRNRWQVAGAAGLTPITQGSGDTAREQGISKAGNAMIRALAIELAWSWVCRQPTGALTRWCVVPAVAAGLSPRKPLGEEPPVQKGPRAEGTPEGCARTYHRLWCSARAPGARRSRHGWKSIREPSGSRDPQQPPANEPRTHDRTTTAPRRVVSDCLTLRSSTEHGS